MDICIQGNGFEFRQDSKSLFVLKIPVNLMDDMNVVDPLGLDKLLKETVKLKALKPGKCRMLLSNEVIFNKIVVTETEEQEFIDQIPLEPENIIKRVASIENEKIVIAVNKKFLNDLKIIFDKSGFAVSSIVPETASLQDIVDFEKDAEVVSTPEEGLPKTKSSFSKIALIVFVIVAIVTLALFFFIKKPLVKIVLIKGTPLPSPEVVASPSATPISFLEKSQIKIQILNKTKTAGLAKKAMDALPTYPNIEIGNVEGSDTTVTNITFSSKIGESERNEIFKIIDNMFVNTASSEAELDNGFDILIELGKNS